MDPMRSYPFNGYLNSNTWPTDDRGTDDTQGETPATNGHSQEIGRAQKQREFTVLTEGARKKLKREIVELEQALVLEKKNHVVPNPQTEIKLLQAKLREMESVYQATKNQLHQTTTEASKAKVELKAKDEKITKLEQDLAVVNQKKRKKDEEYEKLEFDYQNQAHELVDAQSLSEKRLEDNTQMTYELHKKSKEIETQKKEIETQKKEMESLQKTIQEEQRTKELLRTKYVENFQLLEQTEKKYQQLVKEVENQKSLLKKEQSKTQDAQTEIESLNARISFLENEIEEKEVEIADLKKKLTYQADCIKKIQTSVHSLFSVTSNL